MSPKAYYGKKLWLICIFALLLFTVLSFALPSITFQPPTLSDNATTGSNWVYINLTSSEDLNQSLLEWSNISGFTNVSMSNQSASMQNWYVNMSGLSDGTFNYTIWAENTTGGWNQTERKFVTIDTILPHIAFVEPSPPTGNMTTDNWAYINTTVSDSSNTTALIDFNRSLVGWWRFNRESGENDTFVRDWSTWGNNGTINNTNPGIDNCTGNCSGWTASGKFGYGMQFDGVDDYVDIGNPSNMNISGTITVAAWIKRVGNGSNSPNDAIVNKVNSIQPGFYLKIYDMKPEFFIKTNDSVIHTTLEHFSGSQIQNNTYYFLVGAYNGSEVLIYIDGELMGYSDTFVAGDYSNTLPLGIGEMIQPAAWAYDSFNGIIDDVRIYNRALSPEEINASYNTGIYRLYHNFTNLTNGIYTYTAYSQDLAGNVNQTETRTITIDQTLPFIGFVPPTQPNNTHTNNNYTYINVSVTDTISPNNLTSFIDWNRSLVGWWRFNREAGENYNIIRDWSGNGNNGTMIDNEGVKADYYTSAAAGEFTSYKNTTYKANINLELFDSEMALYCGQPDLCAINFTGYVIPNETRTYTFYTTTDDGVRLYINGTLAIDRWVDQATTTWYSGAFSLVAGTPYAFNMQYYENSASAIAILGWNTSSWSEVIPATSITSKDLSGYAQGKFGQAMNFDGLDDYAILGNPKSLDFSGDMTIELWAKPDNPSQIGDLFSQNTKYALRTGDWRVGSDGNPVKSPQITLTRGKNTYTNVNTVLYDSIEIYDLTTSAQLLYDDFAARWQAAGDCNCALCSCTEGRNITYALDGATCGNYSNPATESSCSAMFSATTGTEGATTYLNLTSVAANACNLISVSNWSIGDSLRLRLRFKSQGGCPHFCMWTSGVNQCYPAVEYCSDEYMDGQWHSVEVNWTIQPGTIGISAFLYSNDGVGYYPELDNRTDMIQGEWQHILTSYSRSDRKIKMYQDGVLTLRSYAIPQSYEPMPLDSDILHTKKLPRYGIGALWQQPYANTSSCFNGECKWEYFFNGTIDEVRIYNRALSEEEVNASYNTGLYRLYHNFTNLAEGTYTYTAYAQDLTGYVNQTETRILTIDTDTTTSCIGSCSTGTTPSPGSGWSGLTTTKAITLILNEPLTKIVVNLKQSLSSPSLAAANVESVPVPSPSEPVYKYINITKNKFNNSHIDDAAIYFKVNKSWIIENNFTRIWLARYDTEWNKLQTDLLNSTENVNYYRAYTDAFSYFAIIGDTTEAAQAQPSDIEKPKDAVKEETSSEHPKEYNASAVKEQKATYLYTICIIAAIVFVIVAYAAASKAIKKNTRFEKDVENVDLVPENQETVPEEPEIEEPEWKPAVNKEQLVKFPEEEEERELDEIERRVAEIKKKLDE